MPFDCRPCSDFDPGDPLSVQTAERCPFCTGVQFLQLIDVWADHTFQIGACCLAFHEQTVEEMHADPDYRLSVLRALGADSILPGGLRRVTITHHYDDDGEDLGEFGSWLLDCNIEVRPIRQRDAKTFIRRHHRHVGRDAPLDEHGRPYNKPPAGWKFGGGIFNGRSLIGVLMVGRPVNRVLEQRGWLEVNRLCVRHGLPRELTWKACSIAYRWAAGESRRLGADQLCTYTLQSESGMSLRYARWTIDGTTKGGSWDTPSRRRHNVGPTAKKVRWVAW